MAATASGLPRTNRTNNQLGYCMAKACPHNAFILLHSLQQECASPGTPRTQTGGVLNWHVMHWNLPNLCSSTLPQCTKKRRKAPCTVALTKRWGGGHRNCGSLLCVAIKPPTCHNVSRVPYNTDTLGIWDTLTSCPLHLLFGVLAFHL